MPSETEAVRCSCGEVLLDGMDDSHVKVGEDEFRFRRTTDFVGCTTCGTIYQVSDLRPGLNEGIGGPSEVIDDPLAELQRLAQEIDTSGLSFDLDADETLPDPDYS